MEAKHHLSLEKDELHHQYKSKVAEVSEKDEQINFIEK